MTDIRKWSVPLKSAYRCLKAQSVLSSLEHNPHTVHMQVKWNEMKRLWILEEHVYFPSWICIFLNILQCRKLVTYICSFFIRYRTSDWKRSRCVAVSAARVHPDRIVSRRRSRGGIRQQWQSASEQRGSQRNRSEQGPKWSHSRRTKGNGHSEIQVRFLHFDLFRFVFPLTRTFYFVFLWTADNEKSHFLLRFW